MAVARNFKMIETNGVRLRTVVEGKGPLVILLYGWPQCWYLWRHQIDPLVEAGFQVAVPDQCGFGVSDRPLAIADYNIRTLAADIAGVAPALGHDTRLTPRLFALQTQRASPVLNAKAPHCLQQTGSASR